MDGGGLEQASDERPWDVLAETRAQLIRRVWASLLYIVAGAVVLAVPGPYLSAPAVLLRLLGLALVLPCLAVPALLLRVRRGGYRLVVYADRVWFDSPAGDSVLWWDGSGPFRAVDRSGLLRNVIRTAGWSRRARQPDLRVEVYGLVECSTTSWRRLLYGSGGTGWRRVELPSRYGMGADALAVRLNRLRSDALGGSGPDPAVTSLPDEHGVDPIPPAAGVSLGRVVRLVIGTAVVVAVVAVRIVHAGGAHPSAAAHTPPAPAPCTAALDAAADVDARITQLAPGRAVSPEVAPALARDALQLGTASQQAPSYAGADIDAVAVAVDRLHDRVTARSDRAALDAAITHYRATLPAMQQGCTAAGQASST